MSINAILSSRIFRRVVEMILVLSFLMLAFVIGSWFPNPFLVRKLNAFLEVSAYFLFFVMSARIGFSSSRNFTVVKGGKHPETKS